MFMPARASITGRSFAVVTGIIIGFGAAGYELAIEAMARLVPAA